MNGKADVRPALARVLHATDLTADGDLAFVHSLKLALAVRGELVVFHADPDRRRAGGAWDAFPGVRETLTRWSLLPSGAEAGAVGEALGLHVRKVDIPDKDPMSAVLDLVDHRPVDLVVLASHARNGLDRWLHPSFAEPLARGARLPTLFLPHGARGFIAPETGAQRLRHVLVPVDQAPRAGHALALAMDMADAIGASDAVFHLLHVGTHWPAIPIPGGRESRVRQLERKGAVVDEIVSAADQLDADLIVMAAHGHDGLLDALRGSTTEQVLRRAKRALLAVPAT